jgi:hypothetical protein
MKTVAAPDSPKGPREIPAGLSGWFCSAGPLLLACAVSAAWLDPRERRQPLPGGPARLPTEVERLIEEINAVPPARPAAGKGVTLEPDKLPVFDPKVLAAYRADYRSLDDLDALLKAAPARFPLRRAVREATRVLQENVAQFTLRTRFAGAVTPQVKAFILREQAGPGKSIVVLEEALDDLRAAAKHRGREPSPRWQAHYDYVLARLLTRLVLVYEYNYALGRIRTDSLPALAKGQVGWQLVAQPAQVRIPEAKARQAAREAARLWEKIAEDYPGTPWALAAEQERKLPLGLDWEPVRADEAAAPRIYPVQRI